MQKYSFVIFKSVSHPSENRFIQVEVSVPEVSEMHQNILEPIAQAISDCLANGSHKVLTAKEYYRRRLEYLGEQYELVRFNLEAKKEPTIELDLDSAQVDESMLDSIKEEVEHLNCWYAHIHGTGAN